MIPERLRDFVCGLAPERAAQLRRLLVTFAVARLERRLPPPDKDEGERSCLEIARRWLAAPSEVTANAAAVFVAAECWDGGAR